MRCVHDPARASRGKRVNALCCAAVLTAVVLTDSRAFALPEPVYDPTPREEAMFSSIMARLEINRPAMPVPVDLTIESFHSPIEKRFVCPAGSFVRTVKVKVTTKHVRWNTKVAVERSLGTYKWNLDLVTQGDDATVTANNWLMIDPRPAEPREADVPHGSITNEALLYHELLHGQFVIADMETPEWQSQVCSGFTGRAVSRDHHDKIDPAVADYIRGLAASDAAATSAR